jgi:actin-related protein 2
MADTDDIGTKAIVLDSGTGYIKIGYPNANFPTAVFPTVLGRPVLRAGATKTDKAKASGGAAPQVELKDLMLGDETLAVRHLLDISAPVKNGVVKNMDDMCLLWDYAFSRKLKVDPREYMLSMSEAPICSDRSRSEVFQVMFEKFGVRGMQTTPQGVLALYSLGAMTGIAVDSGEGVTHCTPVYDGYSLRKADRRVDIGGKDVTENLVRLMQRRGYSFHSSADFELVKAIKEKFCYAAVDFKLEKKLSDSTTAVEKTMTLPDNTSISIGPERFEATEVLFDPSRMGVDCDGLSTQIWNSIQAADIDIRGMLYENVILAGGSTMFPGLPSRIEADMRKLFIEKALKGDASKAHRFRLKVHDPPRRKYMAFLGGSCYAQLTAGSADHWITKAQYEEGGDALVKQMFGTSMM